MLYFLKKKYYINLYIENVDEDSTFACFLTERAAVAGSSLESARGRPPRSDFNTVRLSALRIMKWSEFISDNKGGTAYFYVPCNVILQGAFYFV